MAKGIIGQVQLLATLVFAVPVAMLGADFLLSGRVEMGLGFLLVAVLMVALEEYVTKPTDAAADAAKSAASRIVEKPDGDAPAETVESEVVDGTNEAGADDGGT